MITAVCTLNHQLKMFSSTVYFLRLFTQCLDGSMSPLVLTKLSEENLYFPLQCFWNAPNSVLRTQQQFIQHSSFPLYPRMSCLREVKLRSSSCYLQALRNPWGRSLSSRRFNNLKYFFSRILLCITINSIKAFLRKWLYHLSIMGK